MRLALSLFGERPASEPLWSAIEAAIVAPLEAEGAGDMVPTAAQRAEIMDVVAAPESRRAMSAQLLDDWVAAIGSYNGAASYLAKVVHAADTFAAK